MSASETPAPTESHNAPAGLGMEGMMHDSGFGMWGDRPVLVLHFRKGRCDLFGCEPGCAAIFFENGKGGLSQSFTFLPIPEKLHEHIRQLFHLQIPIFLFCADLANTAMPEEFFNNSAEIFHRRPNDDRFRIRGRLHDAVATASNQSPANKRDGGKAVRYGEFSERVQEENFGIIRIGRLRPSADPKAVLCDDFSRFVKALRVTGRKEQARTVQFRYPADPLEHFQKDLFLSGMRAAGDNQRRVLPSQAKA